MENENYCETCKYYVKYYTVFNGTKLRYADCGQCANAKCPNKKITRNIIYGKLPCGNWEKAENGEINEEKLKKTINDMKLRLDEIALLLKRD